MEMTPYSKDGKRELSRFHAQEMIYEYCSGYLDSVRERNMRDALQKDPTLTHQVERIRQALEYCGSLSHFPIPLKEVETLKGEASTSAIDLIIEKTRIQQWPSGLRLGLESLVVVSAIFLVALLVPWNSMLDTLQSDKGLFTLSEVRRDYQEGNPQTEFVAADKISEYDDEGFPIAELERMAKPVESMGIVPQISSLRAPAPLRPEVADKGIADKGKIAANPHPTPMAVTPRDVASSVVETKNEAANVAKVAETKTSATKAKSEPTAEKNMDGESDAPVETTRAASAGSASAKTPGFVYRGRLDVTNVEATTPKLVAFITDLGGRKAGKVPIGWQKAKGSYFHFTIPQAKYAELENFFREYGSLKINKETHNRVMPEGIIRLIIEVEERERRASKAAPKPSDVKATEGSVPETPAPAATTAPETETAPPQAEPDEER